MSNGERTFTAEFLVYTKDEARNSMFLHTILLGNEGKNTAAVELEPGDKEKYQIRSISKNAAGTVFKAVFGRCRFGETPEQTTIEGVESDVQLLPGHGLVEKNYFLFFPETNLIVYQRTSSGSSSAKLQRYLNRPQYFGVNLEPILTKNSYERLLNGGGIKKVELSISKPYFSSQDQSDKFIGEAVEMLGSSNANRLKITLSAERNKTLSETLRTPVATLAKFGRTRVARVHMEGENDTPEVIDLIGDRIKATFTVP